MSKRKEDEEYYELDSERRIRICGNCCSHYDNINCCCWQATEKGLCFDVDDGDECHLGYMDDC